MKINLLTYSIAVLLSLTFISCRKENVEDVVDFNVNTVGSINTFRVGSTVSFVLTGNPDVIAFYSGEKGSNYDYRNRISRNDGNLRFSFQTRAQNTACFTSLASGALKVYFSNNFPSIFSPLTVPALANAQDSAYLNNNNYWTDITSRFSIPTTGTTNTYYPAGDTSLNDLVTNPNYPVTIAFKFSTASHSSYSTNGITLGSLNFYSKFPDTTVKYATDPGGAAGKVWKIVNAANVTDSIYKTTTSLKYLGPTTANYSEDWAVSTSYNVTAYPPDRAIAIKNISNNPLTSYSHKYNVPGMYKVVFVASNNRVGGRSEVVKEIMINIVP